LIKIEELFSRLADWQEASLEIMPAIDSQVTTSAHDVAIFAASWTDRASRRWTSLGIEIDMMRHIISDGVQQQSGEPKPFDHFIKFIVN